MEIRKLRDGQIIPAIGVGTGTIKYRTKNKYQFLKVWIREQLKNIMIKDFKKNNKYPIARDTKKDKMVPLLLDYFIKNYDFCLIDTARAYQHSEEELSKILLNNPQKHCFIISKMTNTHQRNGKQRECIEESIHNIGVKPLDLYILHWPQSGTYIDSYRKLIKFRNEGLTKGIGVANFNIDHLEELLKNDLEMPLINEFECHPFLQQKDMVAWCKAHQIQVIAYAPTGHKITAFSKIPEIKAMCIKYSVNPSQVIMRWHYQNGVIPVFSTTNIEHLKDNLNIFNFELSDEEMKFIETLDCGERYWPDPANCNFNEL